ncbi:hypothetical protein H5410_015374, partial [Solanum commersonii]
MGGHSRSLKINLKAIGVKGRMQHRITYQQACTDYVTTPFGRY